MREAHMYIIKKMNKSSLLQHLPSGPGGVTTIFLQMGGAHLFNMAQGGTFEFNNPKLHYFSHVSFLPDSPTFSSVGTVSFPLLPPSPVPDTQDSLQSVTAVT